MASIHNFAVVGVGGYIAPRHLKAIRDTGNRLVAAFDPKDSVGLLDQFAFDAHFFTEMERFDRHLEKRRRGPEDQRVQWLTICSPNYLHDAHCRLGLRVGANVICEKPLVINPWNLDALAELEGETDRRIFTVLQLRVHEKLVELREKLVRERGRRHEVVLTYITSRGRWYDASWKGDENKSGGVPANIGVHFFDLLLWLFGDPGGIRVHLREPRRWAGMIDLEHARVRWFLSVDNRDLPSQVAPGKTTYRSITVDGAEVEFSEGFTDLHTTVYQRTLAGQGFGLAEARPSIALVHDVRTAPVTSFGGEAHPLLEAPPGHSAGSHR
jgi:UDP-N-acetyl-2-amino-2-deoxyglucuronate dehydrogenase